MDCDRPQYGAVIFAYIDMICLKKLKGEAYESGRRTKTAFFSRGRKFISG